MRNGFIHLEAWTKENGVGTEASCRFCGLSAMDSIGSGFIGSGGDHPALVRITPHNDGLSSIGGMIALLNGGIKSVTVCMDYLANGLHSPLCRLSVCVLLSIVMHFHFLGEKRGGVARIVVVREKYTTKCSWAVVGAQKTTAFLCPHRSRETLGVALRSLMVAHHCSW